MPAEWKTIVELGGQQASKILTGVKSTRGNATVVPKENRARWETTVQPMSEEESGKPREDAVLQASRDRRQNKSMLVVGMPCFNTEATVGDLTLRLKRNIRKDVDQVIVIDDGSHDATPEHAEANGALVRKHHTNRGYGEAIKSCFEAAKVLDADVLVTLDSDGQHDPDEIRRLIVPILRGEADLVIGSRFLSKESNMPRYRRFGIRVITWLFNLCSRTKVSDSQSGFRAYSKAIFEAVSISQKGMSSSIESLEKLRRKGAVFKEVPISCFYPPSALDVEAITHGLGVALAVVWIRLKASWCSLVRRG
jgi:glycosyltransferase involved in cell wall biosynthesis